MHRAWTLLVATILLLLNSTGVRADNWLQTGHDARYTYASKDQVKLPLTDIWTAPAAHPCSVAYGRAYYVVTERAAGPSTLVCASARTGVTLWKQPLWCNVENSFWNYDLSSPCVSNEGVVYVTDAGVAPQGHVQGIHAYNALTGQPVGGYIPPLQLPDVPAALLAYDNPLPLPADTWGRPAPFLGGEKFFTPRLLLDGDGLFTHFSPWLSCDWTPRVPPRFSMLVHLEQQLDLEKKETRTVDRVGVSYQSFVSAGNGVITSGYWVTNKIPVDLEPDFIAKTTGPYLIWHRDFPWRVINPCVDNGTVFALLSGNHGTQAVAALDLQAGATRWVWPRLLDVITGKGYTMLGADPHAVPDPHRIVLADGKLFAYGEALGLVALDQQSGHPLWGVKPGGVPLAASRDHLFIQAQGPAHGSGEPVEKVVALRLTDGKPDWVQEIPIWTGMGRVRWSGVADGQLYARSIAGLTTFAPAERTFRLAVDTDEDDRYRRDEDPAGVGAPPPAGDAAKAAADATVVRLPWNEPLAESNRKLAARRKSAGNLPLLLQIEWLDPQRAAVLGAPAGKPSELPERQAFLARCRALAAEYHPEHLDLAPEVNVYLLRHPEQADAVRQLLEAAVQQVRAVSPKTLTLASFNCEVAYGLYGGGTLAPFGKLDGPAHPDLAALKPLLAVVDELGLSSCPQAAFPASTAVPRDYFLALKQALEAKRVVVTGLRAEARQNTPDGWREQAAFLKHLTQNCYWLDAALVAAPEVLAAGPAAAPAANPAHGGQPAGPAAWALQVWQDVLRWERVEHLTLTLAKAPPPAGAAPAQ